MKHIAAYALLVLGGNEQPSADDVKKVISACDGEVDDAQLEKLLADLADKNFAELVDSGLEKIKDIAIGGADQRLKLCLSGVPIPSYTLSCYCCRRWRRRWWWRWCWSKRGQCAC